MALTQELESDIRRAINPIYADRIGTESHERSALLGEIDRLRGEVDALKRDAERYRGLWRMQPFVPPKDDRTALLQFRAWCTKKEGDAAIDAAMKSEQSRLIGEAKE